MPLLRSRGGTLDDARDGSPPVAAARASGAGRLRPAGIVTLGALLPIEIPTTTAALCTCWPWWSRRPRGARVGLVASVCSFLALNFFFTPPFHTFAVEETADLVALAVFLAVSATVGTMLSRVLEQRARAERREREARLLHHLGTRLRSGVPTEDVLRSLARSVMELFDLARCEITSELANGPIVAERPAATPTAAARRSSRSRCRIVSSAASSRSPTGTHPRSPRRSEA